MNVPMAATVTSDSINVNALLTDDRTVMAAS
jgi:hypothetical protein